MSDRSVIHPPYPNESASGCYDADPAIAPYLQRARELRKLLGYCNCCDSDCQLLTDPETGDSICVVCRSYDVRRSS